MDPRWRKFCQSFLCWKKTNESQRLWNNWKRWVPLVERPNFVPPFPYFAYMQYLEHTGEYLDKLLGYFPKGTHMSHVFCDWSNWIQELFRGFVLSLPHGNVTCFFNEAFLPVDPVFRCQISDCQVCLVFWGSNFRRDWRIQVKFCLQQFHFDFGTRWAKVNFLPMLQGLPFFVGTPSSFLGSHPISPAGDRRVWRPMVWVEANHYIELSSWAMKKK